MGLLRFVRTFRDAWRYASAEGAPYSVAPAAAAVPPPAGQIRWVIVGGPYDGKTGECGDLEDHIVVQDGGKQCRHWRINYARDGRWIMIPEGSGIPPGKQWFPPPYSPPRPDGV